MSYEVIARKYRPLIFSDLTGQEHITRTLEHALDLNRLHHAYLFSGVRGTGKTSTARILAKGLNCVKGITSKPCLECSSCKEIALGTSLDVHEIDAASHTGIDNVREVIINTIAIAPARDRYKVFVIDEIHMLSTSSFNALLKTLEEPPSKVVFIMATTELRKVPDTILSRCQHFEFRQISTEKIFQRLRLIARSEGVKINDAALREIARTGAGSLRDAQSALDQVIAFSGDEVLEKDVFAALGLLGSDLLYRSVEAIAARDAAALVTLVDDLDSHGYDLRNFARELATWLRHLLVVKSGIDSLEVLGVGEAEVSRLRELSERFTEEDLVRLFHRLALVEKEIKDSTYPRFALEVGLLKLVHLLSLQPLEEVVRRLEALETRLGSGGAGPASSPRAIATSKPAAVDKTPYSGEDERFDESEPRGDPRGEQLPPMELEEPESAVRPKNRSSEVTAIYRELDNTKRGFLSTALDEAQSVDYRDGLLTVTFATEGVFASKVRESQTLLRELGPRLFNRPMQVEVRLGAQLTEEVDEAKKDREHLRQRALKSPAVRMFIEKLRGEILDVNELPPEAP